MGEERKIYKVYNGELFEVGIERETNKSVFIRRCAPFSYNKMLPIDSVFFSPQEAIQAEIEKCMLALKICQDRLKEARNKLSKAEKLRSSYQ